MARTEEFPVKFILAISEEMDAAINDWRRKQTDLPNKREAIRRLLDLALKSKRAARPNAT